MSFPEPPPTVAPETLDSHSRRGSLPGRVALLPAGLAVLGLVAAGLVGAVLVRDGGGTEQALAAATSSPSASSSADSDSDGDSDGDSDSDERHRGHGLSRGLLGMAGALHGELVVPDGDGGYRTVVVQRGTATEVGDATLTVRSEDGFTATYDVPAGTVLGAGRDGIASIETGAEVVVTAQKKGAALTATHLVDLAAMRDGMRDGMRGLHGRGHHGPWGRDGGATPAPSTTTEGSALGV